MKSLPPMPIAVESLTAFGGAPDDELVLSAGPSFGAMGVRMVWMNGACSDGDAHGASYLAAEMLDRGTRFRSREAMYEALEACGASVSLRVHRSVTTLDVRMLETQAVKALTLVGELLTEPLDAAVELRRLKGETASAVDGALEEPSGVTQRLLSGTLWRDTAWSAPVDGTRAGRRRIGLDALNPARKRLFGASMVVGVWADQPERWRNTVGSLVQGLRERWPRTGAPRPVRPASDWGRLRTVDFRASKQASVVLMGDAPGCHDPEWPAISLHQAAFSSGFRSPLIRRIRSEEGLSYEVGAGISPDAHRSLWTLSAAPESDKVAHVIRTAEACWREFGEHPLSEEYLEDTRLHIIGQHVVALETVRQRMAGALQLRTLGRPLEDLWTLPERLSAISTTAVQEAGRRYAFGTGSISAAVAASGSVRARTLASLTMLPVHEKVSLPSLR